MAKPDMNDLIQRAAGRAPAQEQTAAFSDEEETRIERLVTEKGWKVSDAMALVLAARPISQHDRLIKRIFGK
jgi:hypothetical protein